MFRIGIFFGGPAREREISFLGGKTTFTCLDRSLFTPVPVFIDGRGNFILLKPEYMEAPSIRDFYPPPSFIPTDGYPFRVYEESLDLDPEAEKALIQTVGTQLEPKDFSTHFDFAFLAVHGPQLEDGAIQGLLEWYGIPYYGSGLMGSGIGIDKIAQNVLIQRTVGLNKRLYTLTREQWDATDKRILFDLVKEHVGLPFVCKAPHQGSSIGVSFVRQDNLDEFVKGVLQSFFLQRISREEWTTLSNEEKGEKLQRIANLDEGIAFPLVLDEKERISHPAVLWKALDETFAAGAESALLTSVNAEDAVLFESFVNGQEFSCGVIQDFDGSPLALPPSEVIKTDDVTVFDFKTKYLTSTTRKAIPIRTTLENNRKVHAIVKETFELFKFGACVRIDGFLTPEGEVLLHDPNTLPGMSPSSFIFKQMAEIGLNVTDSLTYFIRFSLRERVRTGKLTAMLRIQLRELDEAIRQRVEGLASRTKTRIRFEATDEAFEEAKKTYNRISASADQVPVPVVIHPERGEIVLDAALMARPSAAELLHSLNQPVHPLIEECRAHSKAVREFLTGS